MAPGRNEPCPCGSGRKYKFCHLPLDEAPPAERYEAGQRVYIENWKAASQAHYGRKHYHWMARLLEPFKPKRVFDVGCGSGHGLLGLFEVLGPELTVISVDENGACLDVADATLSKAGLTATVVKRLQSQLTPVGYELVASKFEMPVAASVVLIESDICNDPLLEHMLARTEKFDAVTIWLSGVHMMRQFNATIQQRGISADGDHRLYVQNKVYEVADKILRSGGVLQVVDRGEAPTSELLRQDKLRAHREQASVTSLQVTDLNFERYEDLGVRRTPMKFTPGKSGRIPEKFEAALISVISVKP